MSDHLGRGRVIRPDDGRLANRGPRNPAWRGDAVSYRGAHLRKEREDGPAHLHPCADCGRRFEPLPGQRLVDWSLKPDARQRLIDAGTGLAFSPSPSDFEPRCRSCHAWRDRCDRTGTAPRLAAVVALIMEELDAAGGRMPTAEIYARARSLGIDSATLSAARKTCTDVQSDRHEWWMPNASETETADAV